jgi:hypothetical protein
MLLHSGAANCLQQTACNKLLATKCVKLFDYSTTLVLLVLALQVDIANQTLTACWLCCAVLRLETSLL